MRLVLIVNPAASSVTTRERESIEHLLALDHELTVRDTRSRDHATELARDAVSTNADVVFVFGGDGTLNEVAEGLTGSRVGLAVLPGGSTNVFARTLGISYDPVEAGRQLVAALDRRSVRRVGLGAARAPGQDWRHFVFHLGVGFDAAVIRRMEQRSYLKRHFAHPAFALASVATWLGHYDRSSDIRVRATTAAPEPVPGAVGATTAGEVQVVADGPYAVISNSDPYTYVGKRRMTISPYASLDGALSVTVLRTLRLPLISRAATSAVGSGRFLASSADITQLGDVSATVVTSERPFPWQVDGDYLGDVEHLDVRHEPDCLSLVIP